MPGLVEELRSKVAYYPVGGSTVQLRLFTRKKLKGALPPMVKAHCLSELYALAPRLPRLIG